MASNTKNPLPNGHPGQLILFTFPESVFGLRIRRYLNLRHLPFSQIRVPPNMPRPLLQSRLNINYRRIPILSIGRDIYIDTRLILPVLESFFPESRLGSKEGFMAAFEDMLEEFIIDAGPFWRTTGCIPLSAPLLQNEVWMRDREEGSGGAFSRENLVRDRSWCLSQVRLYFAMVEKMLGDERRWIAGGEGVGMAEIHAGWVFDWALGMVEVGDEREDIRGALSEGQFPRVYDWVRRFREVAGEAEKANSGGGELEEGADAEDEVVQRILNSGYTDPRVLKVDEGDVLGWKQGQAVTIAPSDFGSTHQDRGVLVGLTRNEVVIEINVPGDQGKLRLHYPRINFKVSPV